MRLALLHTGALHESTLRYTCRAVRSLHRRAREWTDDLLTIAIYWSTDPQLEGDGYGSCTVVFDVSYNRTPPSDLPRPGESMVAFHQRLAWQTLAYAVDVALTNHADWIFRARFDVHVAEWGVPPVWVDDCVYGFQQAWGWPSDNALLLPARAAPLVFDMSRTGVLGEPAVLDGARAARLRFCWIRVDVWLLKPERRVLGTGNGSTGVRRWRSPRSLPLNDSQPAAAYDHTEHASQRRTVHTSFALYDAAPLPEALRVT